MEEHKTHKHLPRPFESSNVETFHWNEAKQELVVTFSGRRRYVYPGITREQWDAMQKADSKGAHVWKALRGRTFWRKDD